MSSTPAWVSFSSVDVPEHHRVGLLPVVGDADLLDPLADPLVRSAGLAQARQVALDVGEEDRHAQLREALGHDHQGHRFASAGGARHQAVAIAEFRQQVDLRLALADQDPVHPCLAAVESLAIIAVTSWRQGGALHCRAGQPWPLPPSEPTCP
jgi:hypothetical protein